MSMSDFLEAAVLNKALRNVDFTVATVYVSLHNGAAGETGANEITAGANSYARKSVTFGAPAGGAVANSALLQWLDMPAVNLEEVGLWDAAAAGNFLWGGPLAGAPVPIAAGATFEIAAGDLDVSLD